MRPIACVLGTIVVLSQSFLFAEEPSSDEADGIPASWYSGKSLQEVIDRTSSVSGHPIEIEEGVSVEGTIKITCPESLEDPSLRVPRDSVEMLLNVMLRGFGLQLSGLMESGERKQIRVYRFQRRTEEQEETVLCFMRHAEIRGAYIQLQGLINDPANITPFHGANGFALTGTAKETLRAVSMCRSIDMSCRPLDVEVEVFAVNLNALEAVGSLAPWECSPEELRETLASHREVGRCLYTWKGCAPQEHVRPDGMLASFHFRAEDLEGDASVGLRSIPRGVAIRPMVAPNGSNGVELRPMSTREWFAEIRLTRGPRGVVGAEPRTVELSAEHGEWGHHSVRSSEAWESKDVLVCLMRVSERK